MGKLIVHGLGVLAVLTTFVAGGAWTAKSILGSDSTVIVAALIGASGTIFAGWMAWAAVQRQISNSERNELQAREAVRSEMANLLSDINYVWQILDVAIPNRADKQKLKSLRAHATVALPILKHSIRMKDLEVAGPTLGVLDRLRYRDVVRQCGMILKEIEKDSDDLEDGQYWRLLGIRTQFSHFDRYLKAFDKEAAARFEDRVKSKIDHRSQAEQLAPLLDEIKNLAAQPD